MKIWDLKTGEKVRALTLAREFKQGYLEMEIQSPMTQGRSTRIGSMIKWIRPSKSSTENSRCVPLKARTGTIHTCALQGYLAHEKLPSPRTLK